MIMNHLSKLESLKISQTDIIHIIKLPYNFETITIINSENYRLYLEYGEKINFFM